MIEIINSIFDLIFDIVSLVIGADYSHIFESDFIAWLKPVSALLSIIFARGIAYSIYKTNKILKAMRAFNEPQNVPMEKYKNLEDWQKILAQCVSANESDRKVALIAADTLVEKILALAGYSGENLGDRLKNIEPSDLDSLQDLWEAHKIRNRIAHEADYKLSREDAVRASALYEKALRELEYI